MLKIDRKEIEEALKNILEFLVAEAKIVSPERYQNVAVCLAHSLFGCVLAEFLNKENIIEAMECFNEISVRSMKEFLNDGK